jgi:hypothetical protein
MPISVIIKVAHPKIVFLFIAIIVVFVFYNLQISAFLPFN